MVKLNFYFSSLELKVMKIGKRSLTGHMTQNSVLCVQVPTTPNEFLSFLYFSVVSSWAGATPTKSRLVVSPDKNTSPNKTGLHMGASAPVQRAS